MELICIPEIENKENMKCLRKISKILNEGSNKSSTELMNKESHQDTSMWYYRNFKISDKLKKFQWGEIKNKIQSHKKHWESK